MTHFQSKNTTAIKLLCALLVCLMCMPTLLACGQPTTPPVDHDIPSTDDTQNTPTPSDPIRVDDPQRPDDSELIESLNSRLFYGDVNWDDVDDIIVINVTEEQPVTVLDGKTNSLLYQSPFTTESKPGGVALVKDYFTKYDALIEWHAYEEVMASDYRRRMLTIRYEVFAFDKDTGEYEVQKRGAQSFDTSSHASYASNEAKILNLQFDMTNYFENSTLLLDNSMGAMVYGYPSAPTYSTYEYYYTEFVPREPAPSAKNLLQKMQETMGGVRNMTVTSTADMAILVDGVEAAAMPLQESTMRFEGLYEEFPRIRATFDVYGTTFTMAIAGTTYYYDLGEQGKYMVILNGKQRMEMVEQYAGGVSSPAYNTADFSKSSIAKDENGRWVISLSEPNEEMKALLYTAITESMGEGEEILLSDITVAYDITLDSSNRIAEQHMLVGVMADFATGEQAEIEVRYAWQYGGYDDPQTLGVPADYEDYYPCTYDEFYESEYVSEVLYADDLNSDGVAEILYLVNDPHHAPMQPVVNVGVYDPAIGNFIYWDEIMRTHFSAEGVYLYYDENEVPYLLLYGIERSQQGFFASDTNIPAFAQMSYVIMRIKPEENGIYTYHDVHTRKAVYLYDSEQCSWEENSAALAAFLDELNALMGRSVMIADTSLGELWVNTDGEAISYEIDPMWLFGDFEFTFDEGFFYDRTTLEVTTAALTVRTTPGKPAEGEPDNTIGYLQEGDYVIRIATNHAWSLILFDGQLGYVSNNYIRECF